MLTYMAKKDFAVVIKDLETGQWSWITGRTLNSVTCVFMRAERELTHRDGQVDMEAEVEAKQPQAENPQELKRQEGPSPRASGWSATL